MRDDAPRLSLQIGNHVLVADVEDAPGRQHAPPVRHQTLVAQVIAAKLGEIVGVVLLRGEQFREARNAGAEWKWRNGLSLRAKFDGEFGGGTQVYTGMGALRVTW